MIPSVLACLTPDETATLDDMLSLLQNSTNTTYNASLVSIISRICTTNSSYSTLDGKYYNKSEMDSELGILKWNISQINATTMEGRVIGIVNSSFYPYADELNRKYQDRIDDRFENFNSKFSNYMTYANFSNYTYAQQYYNKVFSDSLSALDQRFWFIFVAIATATVIISLSLYKFKPQMKFPLLKQPIRESLPDLTLGEIPEEKEKVLKLCLKASRSKLGKQHKLELIRRIKDSGIEEEEQLDQEIEILQNIDKGAEPPYPKGKETRTKGKPDFYIKQGKK